MIVSSRKVKAVEELTDTELDSLEGILMTHVNTLLTDGIIDNFEKILIIGSYSYNIDYDPKDVDVVVVCDVIEQPSVMETMADLRTNFFAEYFTQIDMVFFKTSRCPDPNFPILIQSVTGLTSPAYDLTNRTWLGKEAGETIPYYFLFKGSKCFAVHRETGLAPTQQT